VRTGSRGAHAGALSLGTLAPGGGGLGAAGAGPCGSARLFWGRRGVSRGEAGQGRRTSGERLACARCCSRGARAAALALGTRAPAGRGSWRPGKPLRSGATRVPILASELPYPARCTPRPARPAKGAQLVNRRAFVAPCGAARRFCGRRGVQTVRGSRQAHFRQAFWRVCAVAPAARVPLRCCSRAPGWRARTELMVSALGRLCAAFRHGCVPHIGVTVLPTTVVCAGCRALVNLPATFKGVARLPPLPAGARDGPREPQHAETPPGPRTRAVSVRHESALLVRAPGAPLLPRAVGYCAQIDHARGARGPGGALSTSGWPARARST
jgi:hypothetical protein